MKVRFCHNAQRENRTLMPLRARDFESVMQGATDARSEGSESVAYRNAPAEIHPRRNKYRNTPPTAFRVERARVLRFPLERVAVPSSVRRFLNDLTFGGGAA